MIQTFKKSTGIAFGLGSAALILAAGLLMTTNQTPAVAQGAETDGAPAAISYKVDTVHSSLIFRVKHMNVAWVFGRFNEFDGSIKFHPDNLEDSSISFVVQAASVDTNSEGRDRHLRSNDFFSASEMPTITFESTAIEAVGGDVYNLKGNVTLLGETRPIEATMTITGTGTGRNDVPLIGALAEFSIKRSEFGMTYGLQDIGDEIHLTVSIEGIQE